MNASFICPTCRRRLVTTLQYGFSQQRFPRATFQSLSKSGASTNKPTDNLPIVESEGNLGNGRKGYISLGDIQDVKAIENISPSKNANTGSTFISLSTGNYLSEGNQISYRGASKPDAPNTLSTRWRTRRIGGNRNRGDLLEELFQEQGTVPSSIGNLSMEIYAHMETLKEMLKNSNRSINDIWNFFVSNLGPHIWTVSGETVPRPFMFDALVRELERTLKMAWRDSRDVSTVPTATEIMSTYAALDLLKPTDWVDYVSDLLDKLSKEISGATRSTSATESNQLNLLRMSEDLLGAWRLLCKFYNFPNRSFHTLKDSDPGDWSFLPLASVEKLQQAKAKGGIAGLIRYLLPRSPYHHRNGIGSMAFVTFALLSNRSILETMPDVKENHFVIIIARILSNTIVTSSEIKESLKNPILGDTIASIKADWPLVFRTAELLEPHGSRPLSRPPIPSPQKTLRHQTPERREDPSVKVGWIKTSLKHPMLRDMHAELASALEKRNLILVNQLWDVAKQADISIKLDSTPNEPQVNDRIVLTHGLCNHFILAYAGLRQPDRAIDVWNHMIRVSLYPNLSTWNAMLEGCKRSRSITALEGVWAKLLASNLQPDMVCWTTRISGLVGCGRPKLAIRALEEMGNSWIQAAKENGVKDVSSTGDIGGVLKPTIQMINAAIGGLLRYGDRDFTNRVLSWGGKLGIKPDTITFNTLLQYLIRDGRTDAVQSLLKHMENQGVKADEGTFTTILDEMLQTPDALSPKEQNEILDTVFTEMRAAGLKANLFTYGKIIHQLLHSGSGDMTAVSAVIKRMTSEGFQLSPHIYTTLVSHHFSQEPPDLEAVRSLLDHIRLSEAVVDHIFWSKVIIGYARAGETSSALVVLGKEDREDSRVTWYALQVLVIALVENKKWDLARQLVRNVKMERGLPPLGYKEAEQDEHKFWRAMVSLDLLTS